MTPQLTHDQARALVDRALDTALSAADQALLDDHLQACAACRAYREGLLRLDVQLADSLRRRWQADDRPRFDLSRISGRVRRQRAVQGLWGALQPVAWAAGTFAAIAVLAVLLRGWVSGPRFGAGPAAADLQEVTATPLGSPEATPLPPCVAVGRTDAYIHPQTNGQTQPLGILQYDEVAPVGAAANDDFGMTWFQITQGDLVGWVSAATVEVHGNCPGFGPEPLPVTPNSSPLPLASATFLPTPTPFPPPSATPGAPACMVAPAPSVGVNTNVYASPGLASPLIGMLELSQWVPGTGIFYGEGYASSWVRIDFNGTPGWVEATYYMFSDGCMPLPFVDVYPPPPTDAPTPTFTPTPTPFPPPPAPSPTVWSPPPADSIDFSYVVPGAVGTLQQYQQTLPGAGGDTMHIFQIRVDIPPAEGNAGRRRVEYELTCQSGATGSLSWGWWGTSANYPCGQIAVSDGLHYSASTVYFIVYVPVGTTQVTYTLTVRVGAYPG